MTVEVKIADWEIREEVDKAIQKRVAEVVSKKIITEAIDSIDPEQLKRRMVDGIFERGMYMPRFQEAVMGKLSEVVQRITDKELKDLLLDRLMHAVHGGK